MNLRSHLRVFAPWQQSFFGKNIVAVASRWQRCVRLYWPEILNLSSAVPATHALPLEQLRQTRYRLTQRLENSFVSEPKRFCSFLTRAMWRISSRKVTNNGRTIFLPMSAL